MGYCLLLGKCSPEPQCSNINSSHAFYFCRQWREQLALIFKEVRNRNCCKRVLYYTKYPTLNYYTREFFFGQAGDMVCFKFIMVGVTIMEQERYNKGNIVREKKTGKLWKVVRYKQEFGNQLEMVPTEKVKCCSLDEPTEYRTFHQDELEFVNIGNEPYANL